MINNTAQSILRSKKELFHNHPSEGMRDYVKHFGLDADFLDSDVEASAGHEIRDVNAEVEYSEEEDPAINL